jgi:hypothetical protein
MKYEEIENILNDKKHIVYELTEKVYIKNKDYGLHKSDFEGLKQQIDLIEMTENGYIFIIVDNHSKK